MSGMQTDHLIGKLEKAAAEADEQGIMSAADGLVRRGGPAVPALIALWTGGDYRKWRLHNTVKQVMVRIGEGAIPHLIEAMGKRDVFAPGFAMEALKEIGQDAIPELVVALVHGKQKVRRTAAETLGMIADGCGSREELLRAEEAIRANMDSFDDAGMLSIRQDAELVADQLLARISRKKAALGPQKDSFMQAKVKPPRKARTGIKAGRQLPLFKR
jgi:hypothetical protein